MCQSAKVRAKHVCRVLLTQRLLWSTPDCRSSTWSKNKSPSILVRWMRQFWNNEKVKANFCLNFSQKTTMKNLGAKNVYNFRESIKGGLITSNYRISVKNRHASPIARKKWQFLSTCQILAIKMSTVVIRGLIRRTIHVRSNDSRLSMPFLIRLASE